MCSTKVVQASLYVLSLISLLLIVQSHSSLLEKSTQEEVEQCLKELNISTDEFEHADIHKPPSRNALCLVKCLLESAEILVDGEIDMEKAKEEFKDDITDKVEQCIKDIGKILTCEDLSKVEACMPD